MKEKSKFWRNCLTVGIFIMMLTAQFEVKAQLLAHACNPLDPTCTPGHCGQNCCCTPNQYWLHNDVNCCITATWTTTGGCQGTSCLDKVPMGWYYSCGNGDCPNNCITSIVVQTSCGPIDLMHPASLPSGCTVTCTDGTVVNVTATDDTCPCPSCSNCTPGACINPCSTNGYHFF
jgi:hypothetical protein